MHESFLFGKLTLNSIPFHNPIIMGAGAFMGLVVLVVLFTLTYFKRWGWLWKDWLTTMDHKKVGIMYLILGGVMFLRGFSDAAMMRLQQALAYGHHLGYLPAYHFNEIFTAHGVIMIFFMAMSLIFGLTNLIVPLQIGARDVAFPFFNALSFWFAAVGAILINISLVVGSFSGVGWLAYPPLSEIAYSPGVGVDYYLWALTISGIGTLLAGLNILVTIIKMRCPGMTFMRMPLFTWSVFCAMILVVISFPILNITLGMLCLDRLVGSHFFTSTFGGNPMLYINFIWTWGHPEVYILILPAFGVFSEVIATFCKKRIFGYSMMVLATFVITFLAFTVWVHHFFTMGAGANVNAFFGIATMIISVPTGVKIFNWIFTMYHGRIHFTTPMMWTLAFLITFTVGGMSGVLMAVPGVDFQMHNSLFLVAHFHNVIIGGVVFGMFAGFTYWFPKMFGFTLNERIGKVAFWLWVSGFYIAFMPLYVLGLMGMTRRLYHYTNVLWHPYLVVAAFGALLILFGIIAQIVQIVVSVKQRHENMDTTGDPWDGRTLEWSIPSPAPFYNFAKLPVVDGLDQFWTDKERRAKNKDKVPEGKPVYHDIHMPKSSSLPFIISVFAGMFGFAMIWDIHWLAVVGGLGVFILFITRTFNFHPDYYVKASEVEAIETKARQLGEAAS